MVELRDWAVGQGTQLHAHASNAEAWYVLTGEVTFEVGSERIVAPPGSFVMAPQGVQHIFTVSQGPASLLMMYWPAGLEKMFAEREEIGRQFGVTYNAVGGRQKPNDPAYFEALAEMGRRYGTVNKYTR
jgi:hypothetical protein